MRASLTASGSDTVVVPRSPRFRLVVLLLRMWRLNALPRRNLPLLVFLKRLAAPRWVLSFGISLILIGFSLRASVASGGPVWPTPEVLKSEAVLMSLLSA